MTEPNVVSFTLAAREKGCSRSTVYYAVRHGQLTTVKVGSVSMIVRDDTYASYAPRETGLRSRLGSAPDPPVT